MTEPIQGYRIESYVPESIAYDQDFHRAMRRRLENLMRMQGFKQQSRVEVRILSDDELADCLPERGMRIVEAAVEVSEYDVEVPMDVESQNARIEVPAMRIESTRGH